MSNNAYRYNQDKSLQEVILEQEFKQIQETARRINRNKSNWLIEDIINSESRYLDE